MELKTRSSFVWKDNCCAETLNNIVIDHGSFNLRYGFCGSDIPQFIVPSVLGRPKLSYEYKAHEEYYCGNEAFDNNKTHFLSFPINDCKIENWDDMEDIWLHMFTTDLNVKSSDSPTLITDGNNLEDRKNSRMKTTEIMFETFELPALFIENEAVLSLYAVGRTHGLVISSGYNSTRFYPVYNGINIVKKSRKLKLGGKHVTNFLRQTISFSDNTFKNALEERLIVNMLKESLCYAVKTTTQAEVEKKIKKEIYDLPDGNIIEVGDERFFAVEGLLNPKLLGRNISGIQDELIKCLEDVDKEVRNDLCNNILLEGGNTLFPFFPERLLYELISNHENKFNKIRIIATEDRKNYSWLGGSIISALNTFDEFTIKKEEYFENGCERSVLEKFNN